MSMLCTMIMDFIFNSGELAFVGIWAFIRINKCLVKKKDYFWFPVDAILHEVCSFYIFFQYADNGKLEEGDINIRLH